MSTMNAVRIHTYGGPEVLSYEEAPRPHPGPGEVVVKVHATSVNPFDAAVRAGYLAGYFNYSLPLIPGTDVAGVVEEVGEGVDEWSPGDVVYGRAGVIRDGAYAEYVALPSTDVARKPESLDFLHAAAVPHVILTAWQALIVAGGLAEGQTVLVHGAGGGVGHVAVQLAKSRGAHVIGTGSTNIDFVRELDVDQAIDYSTTPFEDVAGEVDIVLDIVGGDTLERSWTILKPGGILVSTVEPPSEETALSKGVRQHFVTTAPPIGEVLTEVAAMVDAGKIVPEVTKVVPLPEIQQGHESIESRHTRGKIAVQVVPD